MAQPPTPQVDMHSEEFLRSLMRRQLRLSVICGASFLIALLSLPLANYFAPEVMSISVGGFTLSWFILGVLFFPYVCIISRVFISRSTRLEEQEIKEAGK